MTIIDSYRMRAAIPILLLIASTHAAAGQPLQWSRYTNPEIGVGIDIPTNLFPVDDGPTRNLTGRTFRTSDGRADVSVYSIRNEGRETPASFLRNRFQLPGSSAVYKRVTPRILAVSGFRDDKIWYARCNFAPSRVNCVALNYPANEKRNWDAVVTRISKTLSAPGAG